MHVANMAVTGNEVRVVVDGKKIQVLAGGRVFVDGVEYFPEGSSPPKKRSFWRRFFSMAE